MSAFDWFMWGGAAGVFAMHLLNRAYERLLQRKVELLEHKAGLLQRRLEGREEGDEVRLELNASRVEIALNFAETRRAARDEVQA